MATLGQDLRYAVRRMRKTFGFSAAAIVTLALGLGVNSAVMSIAEGLFLKPPPLAEAARLVLVDQPVPTRPADSSFPLSYSDYLYYRDHSRAFSGLAAHYATSPMHVSSVDGGFGIRGSVLPANSFGILRLQPEMGQFFTAEEDRVAGRDPVAVLSHHLWRTRLGADPRVVGSVVRINGTNFTVVGVAPQNFRGIPLG